MVKISESKTNRAENEERILKLLENMDNNLISISKSLSEIKEEAYGNTYLASKLIEFGENTYDIAVDLKNKKNNK